MKRTLAVLVAITWCMVTGGLLLTFPPRVATGVSSYGDGETHPLVANPVTSIPQWAVIDYAAINVVSQEIPAANVTDVPGISVPKALLTSVFNPEKSTNATNLNRTMLLHFTERFVLNCTNAGATSDFTIHYFPSLVNGSSMESLRLVNNAWNVTFTMENETEVNTFLTYSELGKYFAFNMSAAVQAVENVTLYNGANYTVELEYRYPVTLSSWTMTSTHATFPITGMNGSLVANYSQQFTFTSHKPLNITFNWYPRELSRIINPLFKLGGQVFPAELNETIGAFEIVPFGLLVSTNKSAFTITFGMNYTVGFVNNHVNRWHRDHVTQGTGFRSRFYQLDILDGPERYLLEKVYFNITDIDGAVRRFGTHSAPVTTTSASNNQYTYVDEETGETMTVQNGTRFNIGRMQKATGILDVGLNYMGTYNATLRIMDEVRNPLPGADVTLLYHGARYGVRMASGDPVENPPTMSNELGYVSFYNLPEGNYSVLVEHVGLNHTHQFRVSKDQPSISIEVVTPVPYRPDMLLAWTASFAMVTVVAVVLVKKKK